MDFRDTYLQSQFPTLPAPKFAPLERLESVGHRFLVGSNGLALEVRRPWLYMRKLALKNEGGLALPYGEVSEAFDLLCGPVPRSLLWQFGEQARKAGDIETAGWITWSEHTRQFRYLPLVERRASSVEVVVDRPELAPGEHLIVDLHSHGSAPAYFSSTDDKDDRGEVKFSVVYGFCHRPDLSEFDVAARLCAIGITIPVSEQFSLKEVRHAA